MRISTHRTACVARTAAVVAVLLASAGTTHAASSVTASLDWTTFSATLSDPTAAVSYIDPTTYVYVYTTPSTAQLDSRADWSSAVGVSVAAGGGYDASGDASATTETATGYGAPYAVNVNRFAEFQLAPGQSITASIDYSLTNGVIASTPAQTGASWVELQVLGYDGRDYTNKLEESTQTLGAPGGPLSGTLSVTFTLDPTTTTAPETFRLALNANADIVATPVPEPASLPLMLAGGLSLSLLAALRRKRR